MVCIEIFQTSGNLPGCTGTSLVRLQSGLMPMGNMESGRRGPYTNTHASIDILTILSH